MYTSFQPGDAGELPDLLGPLQPGGGGDLELYLQGLREPGGGNLQHLGGALLHLLLGILQPGGVDYHVLRA